MQARPSIVFAGHPGAGKTTLRSCTAAELGPALRVVVVEEVFGADLLLPNVAHMQTRAARSDREPVDLRRLVAGSCAWRPTWPSSARCGTEALPLSLTIAATSCVLHEGCDAHVHDRVQCSRAHLD